MINPKEIRIGNTIYDRHGNITHVHAGWFYITQDTKRLTDYSPIPLTPEILEKCGFDWSIYHQAFHKDNFEFDIFECYPKGYALTTFKRQLIIAPTIHYLHQLQNLYYSLTGEELEVRELANLTTY